MPSGVYLRTEYHKKKIGESEKGEKHWNWQGGWREKSKCLDCKKKISFYSKRCTKCSTKIIGQMKKGKKRPNISGEKNGNWKGGITPLRNKFYSGLEWANLRKQVFERDDYRCMDCGQRGGQLEANHIWQWSLYPRLRLNIYNLETLCRSCHKERTRQFMKENWINQYVKVRFGSKKE